MRNVGILNEGNVQLAKRALRQGPTLMQGSKLAKSSERDKGDESPFEDVYGFTGKTPVSKNDLYEYLAKNCGVKGAKPEDIDIITLAGTPRNAVHYGYISGLSQVKGKVCRFYLYTDRNGKIDPKLAKIEKMKNT